MASRRRPCTREGCDAPLVKPGFGQFAQKVKDGSISDAQTSDERIEESIRSLAPSNESQVADRSEALGLIGELKQLHWLLFEQSHTERKRRLSCC